MIMLIMCVLDKLMKKFQIYYSDKYTKSRTEVVQKILEEECQSFEIIEDMIKVHKSTRGTSKIAIFHQGKYIVYSYLDLVYYLNEQGLILC